MSQRIFNLSSGRVVTWGLDKPTGGFYFNEFFTDEEIEKGELSNEVVTFGEALTLTELTDQLFVLYGFAIDNFHTTLIMDCLKEPTPTPLQVNISTMFGKDLAVLLQRVSDDLKNYQ